MKRYLLAIVYKENKPFDLVLGEFPWNGLHRVLLKDSLAYQDDIENLGITNNFDLVGYSGELTKYTHIEYETNSIIKRSLVVIAESTNYLGNVYLLTDGLSDPIWKSIPELESYIQKNGYGIANAKIVKLPDGNEILKPIKGELESVDFTKYQIEYRKYLKEKKEKYNEP